MTKILTNRFVRGAGVLGAQSGNAVRRSCLCADHCANRQRRRSAAAGVEEVVVTGIRESLNKARDIKRDATQFVDAIVADDIGKLPDRNVAESLARVSGVQVDRGIAEGTSVSVRGLRQNVYLFNGRQIVDPTGRGGIGLETLGTSTYGLLALVPSELISRLEVTKLASSDQISGALGGIVDVQTPHAARRTEPPRRQGRRHLLRPGLRGRLRRLRARLAEVCRRHARRAGLGLVQQSRSVAGRVSIRSRAIPASPTAPARCASAMPTPGRRRSPRTRKNLGLNGVLQWQPADGVEIIADTFYSKLDSDRDRWWLSFTPDGGPEQRDAIPTTTSCCRARRAGPVLTNTEFLDTDADIWSSALRGNFDVTDRLRASAEVAYTESTSTAHQVYFRLQPIVGITPTVNFDFTSGDLGSYQINGIDLSDPAQLRYTILFDNTFIAEQQGHRRAHGLDLRPRCGIPEGGERRRALRPRRFGAESAARRHPSGRRHPGDGAVAVS